MSESSHWVINTASNDAYVYNEEIQIHGYWNSETNQNAICFIKKYDDKKYLCLFREYDHSMTVMTVYSSLSEFVRYIPRDGNAWDIILAYTNSSTEWKKEEN